MVDIDIWEFVRSFSHVLEGEVISLEKLEIVDTELHYWTDLEIGVNEVSSICFGLLFLALKEFSSPNAWVFIGALINLDGIITAVERNNEFTIVFILVLRNKSGFKSQNVLIISEKLSHIFLWRFWL